MTKSVGLRVIGRATLLATVGAAAVAVTLGVNAVPVSKATPKEPAQYRSAPDTTAVICPPGPPLSENVSIAGASAPKIMEQT